MRSPLPVCLSLPLLTAALVIGARTEAASKTPALHIEPAQVRLHLGEERQFRARVDGGTGAVHWKVDGPSAGSITGDGFYHAPTAGTTPGTLRVTAEVEGSPNLTAEAVVFLEPVSVGLAPAQVTLQATQTYQFRAKVKGATDERVTWSVDGGPKHGRITDTGLLSTSAGLATPGSIVVRATSVADPSKSETATVRVGKVNLKVSPAEVKLKHGESKRFIASVDGTPQRGVTWSVVGKGQGEVSASGMYTMPPTMATPAVVTVIARSIADPSKTAMARIRVESIEVGTGTKGQKGKRSTLSRMAHGIYSIAAPRVARLLIPFDPIDLVVPGPDFKGKSGKQYVPLGGTVALGATVTNSTNDNVRWELLEPRLGELGQDGVFHAPDAITTPAVVQVRATSAVDPTKTALFTVHIPPVVIQPERQQYECALDGAVQLKAKVENSENDHLRWSVEGGEAFGTVTETGLYHPPAALPTPAVVRVRAASDADPTKDAVIQVNVPEARLSLSPDSAEVRPGRSVQLKTKVEGASPAVEWKLTPNVGTITAAGVYVAPETGGPQVVQVTAILAADPTKTATATLRLPGK